MRVTQSIYASVDTVNSLARNTDQIENVHSEQRHSGLLANLGMASDEI